MTDRLLQLCQRNLGLCCGLSEKRSNFLHDPHLLVNDIIRDLKDLGVVIQTNISNYTDKASFFKKRKLLKMIDGGLIDILGSDTHSFTHSTPEVFSQACKTIEAKCGRHTLRNMMHNSKKIFNAATGYEEV